MEKPYLNDTGLNALIQQLSNKIKSHTSGSITDTNGVLDNPNNFATIQAIVDHVKNITDVLDSKTQEVAEDLDDFKNENIAYYESSAEESIIPDNGAILVPITETITSLTAENGRYYRFDNEVNTLEVTLPTITDTNTVKTIILYLTIGTTPAITFSSALPIYYHDGFELEAGKTYEVNALFNGSAWIIASVEIVIPTNEGE